MQEIKTYSEWELIHIFRGMVGEQPEQVTVGIGDDAACWSPKPNTNLVFTHDSFVEGRHFLPIHQHQQLDYIGHRVIHANLSDIAAMGSIPKFALVSLGLPTAMFSSRILPIYETMVSELRRYGATILGGNITQTEGPLFIDITLAGEVSGTGVLRHQSTTGDLIGCTGFPGSSAAGLSVLMREDCQASHPEIVDRFLYPQARIEDGITLADYVHSMTDISDGFVHNSLDLINSSQDILLFEEKLPLSPAVGAYEVEINVPKMHFLFQPSDDYELVFSCSESSKRALSELDTRTPIHWFGEVVEGSGKVWLVKTDGERLELPRSGWSHGPMQGLS